MKAKYISNSDYWEELRRCGVTPLTSEACGFGMRLLCDLSEEGKALVERFFTMSVTTPAWNSGAGSIMLTRSVIEELLIFAAMISGEYDAVVKMAEGIYMISDMPRYGDVIDWTDPSFQKIRMAARRIYAGMGTAGDRNVHKMSGRVV